jgi:peptide/nickel transport system substrate-binding protein
VQTRRLSIAVVLGFALGVTACSSGSAGHSSKAAATLPSSDLNPVPYSQLKSGGSLRLPITEFPAQFNFNQVDGQTLAANNIMEPMMPTPFITNAVGDAYNDANYVTSDKVTPQSGSAPQTVELHLNPKARWSDGTPVTARDYIAQWRALNGSNPKFDPATVTGLSDIKNIAQGSGPYDVVITFIKPYGEWTALFGILFPAKYNSSPSSFDNGYLRKIPVTAGPFKLGNMNTSNQSVTLVRDPNWWGRPAKLDSIVYETLGEDAAVQALANGELDDVEVYTVAQYDKVKNAPGVVVRKAVNALWPAMMFNEKNPILSDVRVRQALQMAVDRPAVIKSQMTGLPVPQIPPLDNHVMLPSESGYTDDSGRYGRYDPAAAKALLTQAGWTPGAGGVRYKAGKALRLTILLKSGDTVGQGIAELCQDMFAQVGVKAVLQTINANDYFQKYVTEGNFQVGIWEWDDTPWPISGAEPEFQQPQGSNLYENFGSIGSPRIDALFATALENVNTGQARRVADQADALIWAEGHSLPFFTEPDLEAEKSTISGYGAFGLSLPDWTDIGYTRAPTAR